MSLCSELLLKRFREICHMKVLAGIVLFNADAIRLQENLNSILPQVDRVAVFDNGGEIPPLDEKIVYLSQMRDNVGIAKALNVLTEYAEMNGYDWILTLDQDSVCPEGLIKAYKRYWDDNRIGIICPNIVDRNYGSMEYDQTREPIQEIDACITSASLMRVSAWRAVGGFWEELFIDLVDMDICWAMRAKGYKVMRVGEVSLYHEIGQSFIGYLFGKKVVVFNHPPFRVYYMTRNTIAVARRHKCWMKGVRWNIKRALIINKYESDRLRKNWMIIKGVIDGILFKIKPLSE